jgi:hypothetical protein
VSACATNEPRRISEKYKKSNPRLKTKKMLNLRSSFLLALAATCSVNNALALPVEDISNDMSPALDRALFSRSLPPCPAQYGEVFEAKVPDNVKQDAARSLTGHVTYGKIGWKHPICGYYQVNCYS